MLKDHKTVTIDTETTGMIPVRVMPGKKPGTTRQEQMNYETDFMHFPYIVELAWKVDDQPTKSFIINQEGREIPKEASEIHGITTEEANKSETTLDQVLMKFATDLKCSEIIVGHNLYFDTSIIKANVLRAIKTSIFNQNLFEDISGYLHKDKRICTMRAGTKINEGKWPKLEYLYWLLFRCNYPAHRAAADVEATYKCYKELLARGFCPTFEELQAKAGK